MTQSICSRVSQVVLVAMFAVMLTFSSSVQAAQLNFATAEEAAAAFADATRANDQKKMIAILGPGSEDLVVSGDPVQDQSARVRFVTAYDAKHALQQRAQGGLNVIVGPNDWPFPIPIVRADGRWHFDGAAGADELVNRRIGRNELLTVRTLLALVEAQKDYFARYREGTGGGAYAQRIISNRGRTDGLYWDVADGQPGSPLGPLVDEARDEGYPGETGPGGAPRPYHGYLFRILKAQGTNAPGGAKDYMVGNRMIGGFAFIAWPAAYEASGVTTFLIGPDGSLFQKDLGPNTGRIAAGLVRFDPDISWTVVTIRPE